MSRATLDAELFSRARTTMCAARENDFALLDAVAEVDIAATGYPSVHRLLEDLLHIDRRDAKRGMLTLTMDLRWLRDQTGHGTLDSEAVISPAEARRIACDAGIVPMVLGSRSEPLDVGRLSDTIPEGMRRALAHCDGRCAFPGCTRRPGRCAAHHVRHWAEGGDTALHNLTVLCRCHHQLIHRDQWRIRMVQRRPWFIPPPWLDPDRTPRPGGRSCPG